MKIEIINFNIKGDERGSLIALEENKNIPFIIKRVYYIFGTKKNVRRGFHAHKKVKQVAICVSGNCKMLLDDGKEKKTILLDKPESGLIIREMIWHEMSDFSENCLLLVLASDHYDEEDYIRDYKHFKEIIRGLK
jgi:dTDP-4-dehydrorhamnose 3,5-epimerase-like enzyme